MSLSHIILLAALIECIAALVLYKMGLEYGTLLIGAAITFLISELAR